MTGFCKTDVPAPILAKLEEIKDNEEAVKVRFRVKVQGSGNARGQFVCLFAMSSAMVGGVCAVWTSVERLQWRGRHGKVQKS